MKTSGYAYVRFLNLMKVLQKSNHISDHHPQAMAVLAYISKNTQQNQVVTITNLVNQQEFGSLPTVLRRLAELQQAGLITYGSGPDQRLKLVFLTQSGERLLEFCSEVMRMAVLAPSCTQNE